MSSEIPETSTAGDIQRAKNSIFHAPAHIRYDRKKDFEPKLVSIGPYYHGQANLKPMEELKRQCVPYLQQKQRVVHMQFFKKLMKFEGDARLFYKEKIHYDAVNFVEMLVTDSCFIIRVILSLSQEVQESMAFLDVNIKEVRSDLLLLENQIPLFFIKEVYTKLFLTNVNPISLPVETVHEPTKANPKFPPFETVLEPFIGLDMPWRINGDDMFSKAAHLLDLYWRCSTSETLNNFGSCFQKLINEPLNTFHREFQILNARSYDRNEQFELLGMAILILEQQFELGFHNQEAMEKLGTFQIDFKRAIRHKIENFQKSLVEEVKKLYGDQAELSYFEDSLQQVLIEQLITFQSGFQKMIDEQRPLIHKELDDFRSGRPSARMVALNSFQSCFEQGRYKQLNNIQSDIGQEMNEQLNYLSIGFDQVINKQLDYLGVGRPGFQGQQPSLAEIYYPSNEPKVIANATVLHQIAGVKFEKLGKLNHEHHRDGLDVIFSNGIMQMPCLKIDSCQKTLLVNLIAYENSKLPSKRTFSSYIKLMDALIDSEKDVELLQQCGVISNTLSSHKMAATFFNDIGNFCLIDYKENCFLGLYENVPKYYDSSWNRRYASFQQKYCSNPWAGISVFAGVTLLILSVLQTFYTIYAYYKPPKQHN